MRGSLGEKIGEGAYADVHAWAPGQVVKLFKSGVPRRLSWWEARMTRAVFAAGGPALEVFDGRGRDEDCSPPPAQIPACGLSRTGLLSRVERDRPSGYWAPMQLRSVGSLLRRLKPSLPTVRPAYEDGRAVTVSSRYAGACFHRSALRRGGEDGPPAYEAA